MESTSANERVSLQLWTVRQALAADPSGTLQALANAGYRAVELAPLPVGMSAHKLGALLSAIGLSVRSIHCDLLTPKSLPAIQQLADIFDCRRIIWHGWPRDARFDSIAGVQSLLVEYRQASEIAWSEGLEFGLHTHWWEFETVDGKLPYQLFMADLPERVFFQLDVYWAQTASRDPLALLTELGSRLKSLHLKDGPAVHGEPMTALGRGSVNIEAIVGCCDPNVDWVVELDECAEDPLIAAAASWQYLDSRIKRIAGKQQTKIEDIGS